MNVMTRMEHIVEIDAEAVVRIRASMLNVKGSSWEGGASSPTVAFIVMLDVVAMSEMPAKPHTRFEICLGLLTPSVAEPLVRRERMEFP